MLPNIGIVRPLGGGGYAALSASREHDLVIVRLRQRWLTTLATTVWTTARRCPFKQPEVDRMTDTPGDAVLD